MCVKDPVDYLIGLDEAGLQPSRGHKAKGGGEFYVWKNSFGRCIGGRHKLIASTPEKNSAAMFTIIVTLFVSDLQYNSLQMPSCQTYSETMLQTNLRIHEVTEDENEWGEEEMLRQQVVRRELLRATYQSGLRVLHATGRSLKKNGWEERYNACIEEMMRRQVVKKVAEEEMDESICLGKL